MPPVQHLLVVGRLFPSVVDGTKTSTIRWNENPIEPGPMLYVNQDAPDQSVEVVVTRCTSMALSEAAEFLGREAEWPPEVMLEGMQEHYPGISLSDKVDVIEHRSPEQSE